MNVRVLVAGESNEPYLALFLGFAQGFCRPIWANEQLGIVVEANTVDLPEIKMVGLQTVQRLLQHLHGEIGVPAVSANLGHQENFVAAAL